MTLGRICFPAISFSLQCYSILSSDIFQIYNLLPRIYLNHFPYISLPFTTLSILVDGEEIMTIQKYFSI